MLGAGLVVVAAYLIGALPSGVILGKAFAATDLRDHGSKSTGATNALRVLGPKYAAVVFVFDFLKGLLPVLVARWVEATSWTIAAVAIAAVAGHCWSPYIGFKGGKGVATGAGAIIGMFPWALIVLPVMILIIVVTRHVSLASLIGSILAAGLAVGAALTGNTPAAVGVAATVIAAIIVGRHRDNIARLRSGSERKLSRRPAPG